MKAEALDAFAMQSIRPGALEAAAASQCENSQNTTENNMTKKSNSEQAAPTRPSLNRLNTPFGQRTDGTESAAKAVEGMVEGVKAAVHEAVMWTEKKAEELACAEDHAGPYDSPATAAGGLSDLDVIATGVLPATVPAQEDGKNENDGGDGRSGF